jgi:hypothetical protein
MAKPRFSWEVFEETYSLILKVTNGDRETTWRIGLRPNSPKLVDLFLEVIDELEWPAAETPRKPLAAPEKPEQPPEVHGDQQMSEAGSAELRAARARSVEKTGRRWYSNIDDDSEELPLYTIGHGDERETA